ncbi:MAG: flavodoxin family protein [Anaerolineae bacterium]|jgi:flavodoxin I
MKVLVVYDSVFGNTEKVAQTIGDALRPMAEVEVLRVGDVTPEHLAGLDALIVGSPTRAFSATPAIKQFVGGLPRDSLDGVQVAAFDTRIAVEETGPRFLALLVRVFGYAAEPIAKRLQGRGGELGVAPAGFIVKDSEGPLREGELERAAEWAKQVVHPQ